MMYSYRAISMPIVNERNQYIGSVFRRDILLIIKFGIYDMVFNYNILIVNITNNRISGIFEIN